MLKSIIQKAALVLGFALLLFLTILDAESFALSVGTAGNTSYNMTINEALSQKKTISRSYQINKEISVYSLYLPFLSYLERHNKFFKRCNIVNNPRTLNHFVKGVNTSYGIDLYAMDIIKQKETLGVKNKMIRQFRAKRYMICVAAYGLIIAQSFKNFNSSLHNGAGTVMSNNVYKVSNNAFYNLVGESLYNAIRHQDLRLKTEFRTIKDEINEYPVILYNNNLKTGGIFLDLSAAPKMSYGGLQWFDPQINFAGGNDMIEIGYNKNDETGLNMDKGKAISHILENTNSLTNDLLNSLF